MEEIIILKNNNKLCGIYNSYELAENFIKSCIECGFIKKSDNIVFESYKINSFVKTNTRKYSTQKTPYIITIGRQEQESGMLSVRTLGSDESRNYTVSQFKEFVLAKIIKRDLDY